MTREDIERILNDQIRPRLMADGGDIDLIDVKDDNTVVVKLTGACGACPFSTMTLKQGVEKTLRDVFPEIKEVISV